LINEEYRKERRGWTEQQSLKHWVEVCKSGTLDFDILEFVRQEVQIIYHSKPDLILQLQETCCKLINCLLREGLPMEEFGGLTFYQMNNRAIQSEITLLALLNACASLTRTLSIISWIDNKTFGAWFSRMQGQRTFDDSVTVVVDCLSWLNLDGASLYRVSLYGARLVGVSLDESSLYRANLYRANLNGANLNGANLTAVSLEETYLFEASLNGANLYRANLDGANLDGANLDEVNLQNISWDKDTNWENVQGLETARNVPEELKQHLGWQ
jgi:uncharacterized protein YjbI with pentapeptide repeats